MTRRILIIACIAALSSACQAQAVGSDPRQPSDGAIEQSTADAPLTARRLAPQALRQDGRVTLSPGFSPDGQTMYFTQANCALIWECPQRLMRSALVDGEWQDAQAVPLPFDGRVDWPSVTPDGRTLLFSWATGRDRHLGENVREDFDLYSLDLTREGALPVPLDEPDINRIRGGEVRTLRFVNNETAPVLTRDGDLYFWSERLDGPGERDVYVARRSSDGFARPVPLPAPINSSKREDGSWVNAAGGLLLFSTPDRGGEGGSDIYCSRRIDGGWSEPVPLGPATNSRFNDFAARLTSDGTRIVFTSDRPASAGAEPGLYQVWEAPVPDTLSRCRPDHSP